MKVIAKPQYEIEQTLVASTGHITSQDNDRLKVEGCTNTYPEMAVYSYEYGYLIYVGEFPENEESLKNSKYSPQFIELLRIAYEHNCPYLKLDCDGPVYKNLATFDW